MSPSSTQQPESPVATLIAAVQLKYNLIRITVRRDFKALKSVPGGPYLAVGAAVVLAIVVGLLRFGITETYAESVVFLGLALLVGLLGWTPGMVLVTLYATFDLAVSIGHIPPETVLGRLISYVILYALVVLIPSAQRTTHLRLHLLERERLGDRTNGLLAASVSALVTGGLVFLWATVAPYLLRPVFEFQVGGLPAATARSLTVARRTAVMALQTYDSLLAIVAVLGALIIAVAYQRRVGVVHVPLRLGPGIFLRGRLEWIGRVLRYALVLMLLTGIITGALDIILIAGALIAADFFLPILARIGIVRDSILRIPWSLRALVAFVVTVGVTQAIVDWRYRSFGGSEFFPFVLSLAIGLLVFRLLLDIDEATLKYRLQQAELENPMLVTMGLLTALIFLAMVPEVALADDCSGLSDCARQAGAAISAAFAALVAAAWHMIKGVFSKTPPVLSQLEALLSEEGAAAQRGGLQVLQEKAAKEYYNATGDVEDYYRVRNMTMEEFAEFVRGEYQKTVHQKRSFGFGISGRGR